MYHLSRLPATGTFQFLDGGRLDREAGDGAGKLLWPATLLAMLARRVFQEFGIGVRELDEVAAPIQRLAVDLNENPPQPESMQPRAGLGPSGVPVH